MRKNLIKIFNTLIIAICLSYLILSNVTIANAADAVDVIAQTKDSEWFQTESGAGEGTWSVSGGKVSVDSFGGNYAMDGATYLTKAGRALSSFEFETTINIESANSEQASPMVGIIPWYVDDDNYLYVSLKFANISLMNADDPLLALATNAEKADGFILEQILVSGRLNGESKYYSTNAQQENTPFDTADNASLQTNRLNPTNATGHTLKVVFEDRGSMASQYITTIYYNGVRIGATDIYYYNSIVENLAVGFLAQDIKATFSNAKLTDGLLTYQDPVLARDWKESNGFIYRTLNANDIWTFNSDETITFNAAALEDGSVYKLDGENFAGYNTARGYTENPVKETTDGVPQNYEVSASFKLDKALSGSNSKAGYGLLAWYKDDRNYVDALIKVTKTGPKTSYELILSGWLDGSNASVGKTTITLDSFDPTAYHEIKVEKKSTGFYVYLDGELKISKNIIGTESNYYYGYNGYNSLYTATKITSKAIYESFDEIVVKDLEDNLFKVSGKEKNSWVFEENNISIEAQETESIFKNRSYLIGYSDVTDTNMSVEMTANVQLGGPKFAELMLSPYIVDEDNFARIGLAWHDDKTYARVYASTRLEDAEGNYPEATITRLECEIADVPTDQAITLKAEKVGERLVLYVNNTMVYGLDIADIDYQSKNYGVYLSNMNLTITSLNTIGYKKYTVYQVGDWTTSGIKYNQWTITNEGHLIGDATYTDNMISDEEDGERNFAIKPLPTAQQENYQMTVKIKQVGESKTSDRVGVMMWYVDDDNFMVFYLDRWRGDSATPRTTIYGRINGQTLPTKYNHGAWLPEGNEVVECNCESSCGCGGNCVGKTNTECESLCGENASCKTTTDLSQVTEWHTITVKKTGNQFVCYVDDNLGARTYTVDAGLPNTTGKTVYAGIYTLNDAVEVSQYNISPVGQNPTPQTPCPVGSPYSNAVIVPTIGTYNAVAYEDEIENGIEIPVANPLVDTPVVSISTSGLASWEAVANAVGYAYSINGKADVITTNLSIQLSNGDTIKVKALGDGISYDDSNYSELLTFEDARETLATPVITISANGVASWEAVPNAVKYIYSINGGQSFEETTTVITVNLNSNDTIIVKAIANPETHLDSAEAEETYTDSRQRLNAPTITISLTGLATWSEVEGAIKYVYKINDGAETETTELSVQLSENDTIYVKAVANPETHKDSNFAEKTYSDTRTYLTTPVVVISSSGLASWGSVANAVKYVYKIDDGNEVETTELSVQLSNGQMINVKAIANPETHKDSLYSSDAQYIDSRESLTVPDVTIDLSTGIASWNRVANAVKYVYVINDGNEVETTELSVQLVKNDKIKVKAISNQIDYKDSSYSNVKIYADGVVFVDNDGNTYYIHDITSNPTVEYSGATPTKEATSDTRYTFVSWDKELSTITGPCTVTAIFKVEYKVTFKDANGEVLTELWVVEGENAVYDIIPTKADAEGVCYQFKSWNRSLNNITSPIEITPLFNELYLIKFVNHDDSELQQSYVLSGTKVTYDGQTPTRLSTNVGERYVFNGWNRNLDNYVVEPTTIKATYYVEYLVKFVNDDNKVLEEIWVKNGNGAAYSGETPTKEGSSVVKYEFKDWDTEFVQISEPTVVKALYDQYFLIEFVNDDLEQTVLQSSWVKLGNSIEYNGRTPYKMATDTVKYTFLNWDQEVTRVTQHTIVKAVYQSSYKVVFMNNGVQFGLSQWVVEGQSAIAPTKTPAKNPTETCKYVFRGWSDEFTSVKSPLVIEALYDEINLYKVTFKNGDEVLLTVVVEAGGTAVYRGALPTKSAEGYISYEFSSWDVPLTDVQRDMTVTALFDDIDNTPTPKLSRPFVIVDQSIGIATWNAVSGATGYLVTINGKDSVTQTECSYQLTEGQKIVVVALGDGTTYDDSDASIEQEYFKKVVEDSTVVEEPEQKGCFASVISSLFGIFTLTGALVLARKKRD